MALILDGLIAFYRFDDGANGIGSGQTVANHGSNTQTLRLGSTTAADTNDPTWVAVGHDFVTDDYDFMAGGTGTVLASWAPATNNYTQIILGRWDADIAGTTPRPFMAHGASGDRPGTIQSRSGNLEARVGSVVLTGPALTVGTWYVVHALRNGANAESGLNTTVHQTNTAVGSGTAPGSMAVGANPGFSQFLDGAIAAVLIYNRALTAAELLEVYNYLNSDIATPRGISIPNLAPTDTVLTPPGASLSATTTAPALTVTDNVILVPPGASLSATTTAPTLTVTQHVTLTPPSASLSATTTAPALAVTNDVFLSPPGASLGATTTAPVLTVTGDVTLTPPGASLGVTTTAPALTVTADVFLTPPGTSLSATTTAPVLSVTQHVVLYPPAAALTATTTAPALTVTQHVVLSIPGAVLTAITTAPSLNPIDAPTPPERIYSIAAEERNHMVEAESRVFVVPI
jgi:hypothetical protein